MKDRKQLAHIDLVNEVIRQLSHRFQPSPQMVKKSIERLIEKEYLERDEADRKKLKYVVGVGVPRSRAGGVNPVTDFSLFDLVQA